MWLLSTMSPATGHGTATAYMIVVGIGIGLVMQVMVLATQNTAERRNLGIATATVSFFRSIGGSFGVAVFGAVFTSRLAGELARRLPAKALAGLSGGGGADAGSLSPELVKRLPPQVREGIVQGVSHALTSTFRYAVPFLVVAFAVTWLLREQPLRGPAESGVKPDDVGRELAVAAATGTAEPDAFGRD
jgi:hypothetical protein